MGQLAPALSSSSVTAAWDDHVQPVRHVARCGVRQLRRGRRVALVAADDGAHGEEVWVLRR